MSKQSATIRVPGLKVTVPLKAAQLPPDLVPPDGPAGEPVIILELDGCSLKAQARLNGKNLRKNLKLIAEAGSDNVAIFLQGTLRPPAGGAGGPFVLEGAGLQVAVKTPKANPAETTSK